MECGGGVAEVVFAVIFSSHGEVVARIGSTTSEHEELNDFDTRKRGVKPSFEQEERMAEKAIRSCGIAVTGRELARSFKTVMVGSLRKTKNSYLAGRAGSATRKETARHSLEPVRLRVGMASKAGDDRMMVTE